MFKRLSTVLIVLLLICPDSLARYHSASPDLEGLRLMAGLPAELPPRVSGFAYDGEKFWLVIYQGRGRYVTLNPSTLAWKISDSAQQHQAISTVSGAFQSTGGIHFVNGKLWVAGSYGDSFGSLDLRTWKVERLFKKKQRDDASASQSYAGMAFDGSSLWIAWHWFKYSLPESQTQLLLKVDPATGEVLREFPLPPGTRNDLTHGLAWDGTSLWHMKDSRLSEIDSSTGAVTAQYTLEQIRRPSGLAWDGEALWIAEFEGKVWRLPFTEALASRRR
jgi:hypothetical protein